MSWPLGSQIPSRKLYKGKGAWRGVLTRDLLVRHVMTVPRGKADNAGRAWDGKLSDVPEMFWLFLGGGQSFRLVIIVGNTKSMHGTKSRLKIQKLKRRSH